jgi:hypothetical protein
LRVQDLSVTQPLYANAGLMAGIRFKKIYPHLTKLVDLSVAPIAGSAVIQA